MIPSKLKNLMFLGLMSLLLGSIAILPTFSAENLRLQENISYFHDLDTGFPIVGDRMDDVSLAIQNPTLVFFGASGDLNTNRQSRRLVALYHKYYVRNLKFVVIDVDKPLNAETTRLIKNYYPGYIPSQILFRPNGKPCWTHTGEVELPAMIKEIEK